MTDTEIIKALECCDIYHQCEGCPRDFHTNGKTSCMKLGEDILNLINRQKAEIERLKEEINALNGNTKKYIAECEKRSREIAEDYRKEIKAEAIKEFADALKSKSKIVPPNIYVVPYRAVSVDDIDNLVKQMTGGEP